VYLEEVLQTSPNQTGTANAVAVFAGVAPKGPANVATRVDSWADYAQQFGGFDTVTVTDGTAPAVDSTLLSYLPYAVFSYYQNGGRVAYIVRVLPTAGGSGGTIAKNPVMDAATPTPKEVFTVQANGVGNWAEDLQVVLATTVAASAATGNHSIFSLQVRRISTGQVLETFTNLSMTGVAGTRPALAAINDPLAGSAYITAVAPAVAYPTGDPAPATVPLLNGSDPGTPLAADLVATPVTDAMRTIDAPLLVSFQPFRKADGTYVVPPAQNVSTALNQGRVNCFVIWDGEAASTGYVAKVTARAQSISNSDSYNAIYCPWITVPDPARAGGTINIPPSGSVQGVMARMDATVGPWRSAAGLPAGLATAVATEVKFSDTDLGSLNNANINVIRAVQGQGICIMGARTRKMYGPDRFVGDRRTLIFIEDSLKLSTQYAVFENNDQRLWTALRNTAQQILQPVWERGGLAGSTAAEAYYITCDKTLNNPQVVQSGEVRMEVGVALQYPAEFVVIRVSQFDSGASVAAEFATQAA
jgi:hypothetical protein